MWRHPGTFLAAIDGDSGVWGFRTDNVLVHFDRATGTVTGEYPTLWKPAGLRIIGGRAYIYTSDGLAYSLNLSNSM